MSSKNLKIEMSMAEKAENIGEAMSVAVTAADPGPLSSSSSSSSSSSDCTHDPFQTRMISGINNNWGGGPGGLSEIEEEEQPSELFEINRSSSTTTGDGMVRGLFSSDFHKVGGSSGESEDAVYVALLQQGNGKGAADQESSSMDALLWTLNHALNINDPSSSTTLVFLVHVFPEIKHIPMPLGMMPVSQVNPEQKENYMAQERSKRTEFLNKFLGACSAAKVNVDTILIESDMEAKAILDLIPILNIRKLVLGTTKSNLRKMRSRRTGGVIYEIVKGTSEFCKVKIICEGKEMVDFVVTDSPSPSPRASYNDTTQPMQNQEDLSTTESFRCGCFKPKVYF